MIKKIFKLLFLFYSPLALSDPWLVTVSSQYIDQYSHKLSTIQGMGSITLFNEGKKGSQDRYFVKTASHVSQGINTKIRDSRGIELEMIGRLSDNLLDCEWIEVKPTEPSLLYLDKFNGAQFLIPKNYKFQVENIVASAKLDANLNLDTIAFNLENSEYEPEQFPGLVYRMAEPKVAFLLFGSGKIVCTGGRTIKDVNIAVEKVYKKLKSIKSATKKSPSP